MFPSNIVDVLNSVIYLNYSSQQIKTSMAEYKYFIANWFWINSESARADPSKIAINRNLPRGIGCSFQLAIISSPLVRHW